VSFRIKTASATAIKKSDVIVRHDAPDVTEEDIPSIQFGIYALSFKLYELLTVQHTFSGLKGIQIITKFTFKGECTQE
jgi:hypothetical protein